MSKGRRRRLSRREKERRREFVTIFVRGKQKRVRRPPLIDGMDPEDFILLNADPTFLHENEMWEYMTPYADEMRRNFGSLIRQKAEAPMLLGENTAWKCLQDSEPSVEAGGAKCERAAQPTGGESDDSEVPF